MDRFTLRQLRYFDVLAKQGHFGRAAEAASISQPALSMQIKELEEVLGVTLFERTARRVRLTSFGEAFAHRVEPILNSIDELQDMARVSRGSLSGRFKLGIIPTIAPYLLPKIIECVSKQLPGLELHVRESQTVKLIEEVLSGKLDVAVVALPVSEPSLHEEELLREEFVLVRPNNQKALPVPPANELREMRLLLLEEGHCFREQALAFCNLQPVRPREMLDGSSLSTLVQLVAAGMGITLIPEMAVEIETGSADVATARFDDPKPQRAIGMVWRRKSPLAEEYQTLANILENFVGKGE